MRTGVEREAATWLRSPAASCPAEPRFTSDRASSVARKASAMATAVSGLSRGSVIATREGERGELALPPLLALLLWLPRRGRVRRLEPLGARVVCRRGARQVRERGRERLVVLVHSLAPRLFVPLQEPGDDGRLDVDHAVGGPGPVGKTGRVVAQHSEPVRARVGDHAE